MQTGNMAVRQGTIVSWSAYNILKDARITKSLLLKVTMLEFDGTKTACFTVFSIHCKPVLCPFWIHEHKYLQLICILMD